MSCRRGPRGERGRVLWSMRGSWLHGNCEPAAFPQELACTAPWEMRMVLCVFSPPGVHLPVRPPLTQP